MNTSFSLIDVCSRPRPSASLAWIVLLLMTVAAVSIERFVFFRRSRGVAIVREAGRQAREAGAGRAEGRRAMERAAREHGYELGQGFRGLLAVSFLAPAVGLLATVAGLTAIFRALALTSSESLAIFAYGLSEALVPLAWLIAVGLFSFWSHALFERRRERIALE